MRSAAVCLSMLALAACATPTPPEPGPARVTIPDISGDYSNFGQAFEAEALHTTWDLQVRPLAGHEQDSYLVTRLERATGQSQTRLYRFTPGAENELELRIAVLGDEQGELAPDDLLEWARGQFDPGCTLPMHRDGDGWRGQTDPATCRISQPVYGDIGVLQTVRLRPEQIVIGVRLPDLRDESEALPPQEFDRVHEYRVWAGIRRSDEAGEATELVLSAVSDIRSDGRVVRLQEPDGTPMELNLLMSYLPWQPNEPDYLRLDVYHAETGAMMGYYWARPGAGSIEFNGEWLQVWAERMPGPAETNDQPGE